VADETVEMFKIIIFVFLPITPEIEAIEVTHLNSQILQFRSMAECRVHVRDNLQELKNFSRQHYDAPVQKISCMRLQRDI
jgi:hypothetical protein